MLVQYELFYPLFYTLYFAAVLLLRKQMHLNSFYDLNCTHNATKEPKLIRIWIKFYHKFHHSINSREHSTYLNSRIYSILRPNPIFLGTAQGPGFLKWLSNKNQFMYLTNNNALGWKNVWSGSESVFFCSFKVRQTFVIEKPKVDITLEKPWFAKQIWK